MSKIDDMNKVRDDLVGLKASSLYQHRIENEYIPVIGEGNLDTRIMLVGEAPGKSEAKSGKPFCGASGKFLSILIESIGLKREQVYITNVVKDRPPENRDPTPEEIELYGPLLMRQIDIIRPGVIATLGRHSMDYIMRMFGLGDKVQTIGKIHGQSFDVVANYGPVKIVTLYHPALALYNGGKRELLKQDFAILKKFA